MNNMRLDFLVKKREASCHPYANLRPYFPAKFDTSVTSSYIISYSVVSMIQKSNSKVGAHNIWGKKAYPQDIEQGYYFQDSRKPTFFAALLYSNHIA